MRIKCGCLEWNRLEWNECGCLEWNGLEWNVLNGMEWQGGVDMQSLKTMIHKTILKLRYSRTWYRYRRLTYRADPVGEIMIIVDARIAGGEAGTAPSEIDLLAADKCLLIPSPRRDGVGIQAMVRISTRFLARQVNATYVHVPFTRLAHQRSDSVGKDYTFDAWAQKWEEFLNLGADAVHVSDLVQAHGRDAVIAALATRRKADRRRETTTLVERLLSAPGEVAGMHSPNLELCRALHKAGLEFDAEYLELLRARFAANGYVAEKEIFSDEFVDVAIHIRKGDVWKGAMAGATQGGLSHRLVSEEYYVELLGRLQKFLAGLPKPVRFHVFSDGRPDDFPRFTFADERVASVRTQSGLMIENIQFYPYQSAFDALYHMANAPVLVPSKSAFSVLALLVGDPIVVYESEITDFFMFKLLKKYMRASPHCVSLDEPESKSAEITRKLVDRGKKPEKAWTYNVEPGSGL